MQESREWESLIHECVLVENNLVKVGILDSGGIAPITVNTTQHVEGAQIAVIATKERPIIVGYLLHAANGVHGLIGFVHSLSPKKFIMHQLTAESPESLMLSKKAMASLGLSFMAASARSSIHWAFLLPQALTNRTKIHIWKNRLNISFFLTCCKVNENN